MFVTRLIICFVEVVLDSRDRDILNNYIPLLAELVESPSRAYRFSRESVVATFFVWGPPRPPGASLGNDLRNCYDTACS